MRRAIERSILLVTLLAGGAAGAAAAAQSGAALRLMTLLAGSAGEYQEAFDSQGQVVRPIELEEAALLLEEARDQLPHVDPSVRSDLGPRLDQIAAAVAAKAPAAQVVDRITAARQALAAATGMAEETLPAAPPSAARGEAVFAEHCASCHGAHGAGDGHDAATLVRKPADFTDPGFMRGETPRDFFHVITLGRKRSGMPAWGDALPVQARWDLVAHLWTLSRPATLAAEGQGVYVVQCAGCHGSSGDGVAAAASTLAAPVPDLSTVGSLSARSDAELGAVVRAGVHGTPMPAFGRLLDDAQVDAVVWYLRLLSFGGPASRADSGATQAIAETRRLMARAVEAYRSGEPAAAALATDAYARFEPLEKRLGAIDASAVRAVEEAFLRLRTALRRTGSLDDVTAAATAVGTSLDRAAALLAPSGGGWTRFVQAAGIVLREGFEIVLVITALLAYVRRSGHEQMLRFIYGGTAGGVVASVATAALLMTVFRLQPGLADLLEGVAMLLAAVVLFWVSYWLISKAEADRWQRYIQGKVKHALATGSGAALGAAAFLAVYREGFETVLFYQALLGSTRADDVMVIAGFVTGTGLLGFVYAGISRLGLRMPVRQFFLVTGGFLYLMAIVFAGSGVRELQEVGLVAVTPIAGVPQLDALGLHPTLETLLAQGVFVALLAYAVVRTLRRRSTTASDSERPRAEVTRLPGRGEGARAEAAGRDGRA